MISPSEQEFQLFIISELGKQIILTHSDRIIVRWSIMGAAHVRRQAGRYKRAWRETGSSWIQSVTVSDSTAISVIEVRQRTNDRRCPSVGEHEARKPVKDMLSDQLRKP